MHCHRNSHAIGRTEFRNSGGIPVTVHLIANIASHPFPPELRRQCAQLLTPLALTPGGAAGNWAHSHRNSVLGASCLIAAFSLRFCGSENWRDTGRIAVTVRPIAGALAENWPAPSTQLAALSPQFGSPLPKKTESLAMFPRSLVPSCPLLCGADVSGGTRFLLKKKFRSLFNPLSLSSKILMPSPNSRPIMPPVCFETRRIRWTGLW